MAEVGYCVKCKAKSEMKDAKEVEKWLNTQPEAFTIFKKYSYDEMKESLLSWLHPEAAADEPAPATPAPAPAAAPTKPASFALNTKPKADIDTEFDELFK